MKRHCVFRDIPFLLCLTLVCLSLMFLLVRAGDAQAQVLPGERLGYDKRAETLRDIPPMSTYELYGLFDLVARTHMYDLFCDLGFPTTHFMDNYYTIRRALFYRYSLKHPEKNEDQVEIMVFDMNDEIALEMRRIYNKEGCDTGERDFYDSVFEEFGTMSPEELLIRIEGTQSSLQDVPMEQVE